MPDFRIDERLATLAEYRRICTAVGWEHAINFDAAEASLAASLYGVVAVDREETAVGMARLVGDGAIYFYVQDVAVVPGHDGRGIGAALVRALVEWLEEHAPERAFVGLFAATGTDAFYRRFGFEAREPLTGMFRVL